MAIHRTYQFGKAVVEFILDRTYADGTGIQVDAQLSQITIVDWDRLSTPDQTSIDNFFTAKGWNFFEDLLV